MTTMTYCLLGLVLLVLIILVNALSNRSIKRKARALSDEIERHIDIEVEYRLEEARIADHNREHH
tara:strand:- start:9801 stop:9995 length:195 start_codon:yes stop_codon:yes gene_type:complete